MWQSYSKMIKYLSPAITNKILNDFSSGVLTKLQQDIQKAKYYTFILDKTTDISDKEQVRHLFAYHYGRFRYTRGIL